MQESEATLGEIGIKINGDKIHLETEPPYLADNRTMIPIRSVTTLLGATQVVWQEENQLILIDYEQHQFILKIGSITYWLDGEPHTMDVPPVIRNGHTMVPLRVIAETMSCQVAWEARTRTVLITKENLEIEDQYKVVYTYTEEDLLWLARISYIEGFDIGYEAKLAVANVVLNRVKSPIFPDTIYEVIFETAYTVQFPPAHRKDFKDLVPSEESWLAARDALEGNNNIEGCLYFNNRPFKNKAEDLFKIIEGEYFYK